jgi:hypothetical protein
MISALILYTPGLQFFGFHKTRSKNKYEKLPSSTAASHSCTNDLVKQVLSPLLASWFRQHLHFPLGISPPHTLFTVSIRVSTDWITFGSFILPFGSRTSLAQNAALGLSGTSANGLGFPPLSDFDHFQNEWHKRRVVA